MKTQAKILIIQTAFIGDVILATPLIEALKRELPDSQIHFLTIPKAVNIIENNPHVTKIIEYDKHKRDKGILGLYHFGRKIKREAYDICLTPHRSLRSAYLTRKTRAQKRIGFDRSAWKGAFTDIIIYPRSKHEIERNLSLLAALDIKSETIKPFIYPTEEDINHVETLLTGADITTGLPLFAIAPASVWPTKRWPTEYYARFCQLVAGANLVPVLIGGAEDSTLCAEIQHTCKEARIFAGRLTLRQTCYLLQKCAGLLTNDSAPLHVGQAAGIPVYAIFGATVPQFGFAPRGKQDLVIENSNLACRPCSIHGQYKCPTGTFDCMLSLKPQEVFGLIFKKG